jgi:hypothetical protein
VPGAPEEKTDPGRQVTVGEMRRSNNVTRVIIGAAAAFVGAGGFAGVVAAASLVRTEARAQAKEEVRDQMKVVATIDAGQKGLEVRVTTLEQQVPQLRAEVYDARVEQKEYARGLQEVILTNRPSPRLSKPLPPPPPAPPPPTDSGR